MKVMAILLVVFAVLASTNFVFAADNAASLKGELADSMINFEYGGEVYNSKISTSNGSSTMTSTDTGKTALSFDGYVVINLTKLSDDDIKKIESKLKSKTFDLLLDGNMTNGTKITCKEYDYKLDGKMLNITFKDEDNVLNQYVNSEYPSGSMPLRGCQLWSSDLVVNV